MSPIWTAKGSRSAGSMRGPPAFGLGRSQYAATTVRLQLVSSVNRQEFSHENRACKSGGRATSRLGLTYFSLMLSGIDDDTRAMQGKRAVGLAWSQDKLAKAAGVSLSNVKDFEAGKGRPILDPGEGHWTI
jgi:hypothetical protein